DPAARTTLVEAAIIDETNIKGAERSRLAEHVGLQRAGHVPGRLSAHGGIEREDQAATRALGMGGHRARLRDKGGNLVCRGRLGVRQRAGLVGLGLLYVAGSRFGRFAGHLTLAQLVAGWI